MTCIVSPVRALQAPSRIPLCNPVTITQSRRAWTNSVSWTRYATNEGLQRLLLDIFPINPYTPQLLPISPHYAGPATSLPTPSMRSGDYAVLRQLGKSGWSVLLSTSHWRRCPTDSHPITLSTKFHPKLTPLPLHCKSALPIRYQGTHGRVPQSNAERMQDIRSLCLLRRVLTRAFPEGMRMLSIYLAPEDKGPTPLTW